MKAALKIDADTPPPGFMARCPKCDHELCGMCGETFHSEKREPDSYEAKKYGPHKSVRDGDFCCQCDARFQIAGKRYA